MLPPLDRAFDVTADACIDGDVRVALRDLMPGIAELVAWIDAGELDSR